MKTQLLSIFIFLASTTVYGQGSFAFREESHEFLPFVVGKTVTHVFKFQNTGNAPIVISEVDAGCGCTNITWTKDPVMPQDSGFVSVSYDSEDHEGNFFKNIHVYSNAKTPDYPLLIRGIALPDPGEASLMVLEADTFDLGAIPKWTQVKKKILVRNEGKTYLNVSKVTSSCNCVHLISYAGMRIYGGKEKEVELMYNAQETGDPRIEEVTLHTNSVAQPKVKIYFKGRVVNKLSDLEGGK